MTRSKYKNSFFTFLILSFLSVGSTFGENKWTRELAEDHLRAAGLDPTQSFEVDSGEILSQIDTSDRLVYVGGYDSGYKPGFHDTFARFKLKQIAEREGGKTWIMVPGIKSGFGKMVEEEMKPREGGPHYLGIITPDQLKAAGPNAQMNPNCELILIAPDPISPSGSYPEAQLLLGFGRDVKERRPQTPTGYGSEAVEAIGIEGSLRVRNILLQVTYGANTEARNVGSAEARRLQTGQIVVSPDVGYLPGDPKETSRAGTAVHEQIRLGYSNLSHNTNYGGEENRVLRNHGTVIQEPDKKTIGSEIINPQKRGGEYKPYERLAEIAQHGFESDDPAEQAKAKEIARGLLETPRVADEVMKGCGERARASTAGFEFQLAIKDIALKVARDVAGRQELEHKLDLRGAEGGKYEDGIRAAIEFSRKREVFLSKQRVENEIAIREIDKLQVEIRERAKPKPDKL